MIPIWNSKIWDFWAPRYERLWVQKVSLGPTHQFLAQLISPLHGGSLLDIGCGTGQFLRLLSQETGRLVGVDPSPEMIAQAQAASPGLTFLKGGFGPGIPLPPEHEGGWDVITMTHSFPYVPDQTQAMAYLANSLAPSGRVILAQASSESLFDRIVLTGVKLTTSHARYLPPDQMVRLMEAQGLGVQTYRLPLPGWMPLIAVFEGRKSS